MDWANWQANIETILDYFWAMGRVMHLNGPMKKDELLRTCSQIYTGNPIGIEGPHEPIWAYSGTWKNTFLPAMFKLCLFQESEDGVLDLTPASRDLIERKVTPRDFFRRQLIEYQYINPKQQGDLNILNPNHVESNLFPYWVLLKFLRELGEIRSNEALYLLLKLDNYSEKIFDETLEKIKRLRAIEENTHDHKVLEANLEQEFGPKNPRKKAWQYERPFLKWTGFAKDGPDKSLLFNVALADECDKWLEHYPTYREYTSYDEWVDHYGRAFDHSSVHIGQTKNGIHLYKLKEDDQIVQEAATLYLIVNKNEETIEVNEEDILLVAKPAVELNDYIIDTELKVLAVSDKGQTLKFEAQLKDKYIKPVTYGHLVQKGIIENGEAGEDV